MIYYFFFVILFCYFVRFLIFYPPKTLKRYPVCCVTNRNMYQLTFQTLMDPNTMGLPTGVTTNTPGGPAVNGYRCGSNTSSSSGRGSSIQHASLPRHFSNQRPPAASATSDLNMPSPMSEVPIITNGLPSVSAHIPLQHHNLSYNTANKNRPPNQNNYGPPASNYGHNNGHNNSYYYQQQRPPLAAPSNGVISGQPTHQYNSHYRGPQGPHPQGPHPQGSLMHPPRKPLNHGGAVQQNNSNSLMGPPNVMPLASDYAILKFNNATNQNGSVGKEIDV